MAKKKDKPFVTNHGKQRIKDRLGVSKKLADKLSMKALEHGIGPGEVKGSLRKYLDALYFKYETANNLKIYNRKVYVFVGDRLVTVLNLPNQYSQKADKAQKLKKERTL